MSNNLYNEENLIRSYEKIDAIDYHQEVEVEGIKFTSYNAGHVLGAAMFLIEIAGVKVRKRTMWHRDETDEDYKKQNTLAYISHSLQNLTLFQPHPYFPRFSTRVITPAKKTDI